MEYLGGYTPKVAISNHRIEQVDAESVIFSSKDYRQNGLKKSLTLSHSEFTRRFAQHILPKRFVRIRHYGFLSSTWKRAKFKHLREYFKLKPKSTEPPRTFLRRCRCCGEGNLVTIEVFGPRGPPASYMGVCQSESNDPVS
ncbi:hypothetical protein DVG78_08265 [Runella aurantiaca]|uniref:Transposase IS801/IS1294 domain-containing protein n=1 Tax=Runella aurantiaca TaxID=2282308 RepID=A0A369IG58_9BACT|nr:hypothetical protein DVG78_08265 [Runella aurantiaca]